MATLESRLRAFATAVAAKVKELTAPAPVALGDAALIAFDMAVGVNFKVTLGGSRSLAFPTNLKVGQKGFIRVQQDATGGRTLSFGPGGYRFADNSTAPSLNSGANAVTVLYYEVTAAGEVSITGGKPASGGGALREQDYFVRQSGGGDYTYAIYWAGSAQTVDVTAYNNGIVLSLVQPPNAQQSAGTVNAGSTTTVSLSAGQGLRIAPLGNVESWAKVKQKS